MADQSISQLGTATTLTGDELTVVVQNGVTKQTQLQDIADLGGPAGPVGPQGPTGPTGPGATIEVNSTVTGAPGTDASVTNVGSLQAALFNFVIPRGDTGATGATGATGPVGPGVAAGGTAGQYLKKTSSVDYQTTWDTLPVYVTSLSGTANQITVLNGTTDAVISITDNAVFPGVGAVRVPYGTTAERSAVSPANGMIRYNTDTGLFEGFVNGTWTAFASGSGVTSVATGTGLTGGPITSTGTISIANTAVTAGTYGSGTQIPVIAVNAQGQITSASNTAITPAGIGAVASVSGTANEITATGTTNVTLSLPSALTFTGKTVTGGTYASPAFTGALKLTATGASAYTPFAQTFNSAVSNFNGYQLNYIQNTNNGSDASVDYVAYNDASDVDSYFIDMGISSSNYTSPTYTVFPANGGYLYTGGGTSGQASALLLGTSNAASDLIMFTGGTLLANTRATIKGNTGNVLINTSTDLGYKLSVIGSTYIEGVTLFGDAVTLHQDPVTALEAATKQYVDSAVSTGFTVHNPAQLATTAALPTNTYNNGAAGVGATLTAVVNGALTVDSVAVTVGNRILVKNEVAAANNGCYVVTSAGSVGTPYILTRAADFNQAIAGEIANNAYFFVESGTVNAGSSFVLSQTAAITVGTTALPFTEFANQLNYVGGTNIDVTGLTISLTGTVAATNGGTGTSTVTTGDLLYGSAANTWSKLPLGVAYKSLVVNASGTNVEWNAIALNQASAVSGALGVSNGGTGLSTVGTNGQVLTSNGTSLVYTTPTTGTVTAVTGVSPVVSSGGTTPAISMPAATTSVSGYLTSTDWNTFNNKTSNVGTVTSVSGTGTVNGLTLTGTVTVSGSLTLGGTLDLSSPPAIGGTTPAAITGTTITATKYVGISGGTF